MNGEISAIYGRYGPANNLFGGFQTNMIPRKREREYEYEHVHCYNHYYDGDGDFYQAHYIGFCHHLSTKKVIFACWGSMGIHLIIKCQGPTGQLSSQQKTSDPVRVLEKHDSPQMEKLETWMGQNVWETSAKHMESHLFGTPMYV